MSLFYCFTFILLQLPGIGAIENKVRNFEKESGISQGIVSLSVKDCASGEYLLNVNGNKFVNSASTLKLVSTATVIEVLGGGYTFSTELGYSGEIMADQLQGNLYISGNGDPSFGSARWGTDLNAQLSRFVNAVKMLGVKTVTGDLILMNSDFEKFDIADTWPWNDLGNYYGATPYLLNLNENKFTVFFEAGDAIGTSAKVVNVEPSSSTWKIINQVTTAEVGSGDNVYMYSSPLSNTILMKGTIPLRSRNFSVRGAIPNPPQLLGELLVAEMSKQGIAVGGKVTFQSFLSADVKPVLVEKSIPLRDLAESCNFFSINLLADSFVKHIGYKQSGNYTYEAGLNSLTEFWKYRGINTDELLIKDGSGLSPSGMVTSSVMCDILNSMEKSINFETFKSTIPQLGTSGTVASIGNRSNGNVYVKSGSIESTRAYAGYIKTPDGNWLSFMLCINRYHPDVSGKVNKFLREILLDLSALN